MHFSLAPRYVASAFLTVSMATAAAPSGQPVIEVFLPAVVHPTGLDMVTLRARDVVTKIYAEIGVKVVWAKASKTPGCDISPMHAKILVTLTTSNSNLRHHSALAYADPYLSGGPCVMLLEDRLQDDMQWNPVRTGFLLGHTLAHEIGHVLQGVARHSETGVMKTRWSLDEVRDMPIERLHFEAYDRELILDALGAGSTIPTLFTKR